MLTHCTRGAKGCGMGPPPVAEAARAPLAGMLRGRPRAGPRAPPPPPEGVPIRSPHVPEVERELRLLLRFGEPRLEIDHRRIAALYELAVHVEHVGDSARHACGEIAPGQAE